MTTHSQSGADPSLRRNYRRPWRHAWIAPSLVLMLLALPVHGNDEDFRNPPPQYGPSAFWWWFVGAPYTNDDIRLGVDALQKAGLGGFRITPVYSFPGAPTGGPTYLSPGYLHLVQTAIERAGLAGLVPDALLGTGWPYGGPYIPPEMGASQLKYFSSELRGPGTYSGRTPGTVAAGESLVAVQVAQATPMGGVDLGTITDITSQVDDGNIRHWAIPPGRWILMTFASGKTGMRVKRAAPGGEGLVLDHFRREALELHLRHNGDVQAPYLKGVRSVTMDSWEVFDANWTPALPAEFARRRGYRLEPYLAALFFPAGEFGSRIRYDFRRTVSELALENFFEPLRDWAHAQGFQTAVEAHGTPADVIEAYGRNDSPEAETYGRQDRPGMQIRDRRMASSAAHLFGRRQVSCETFTWLRYPLFSESLAQMKAAADGSYLDGVNQVNFHGVPFSPASAPPPGFFFYASTFVSPGNTWWPYLSHLSDYLRRANFLLQQGEPVSDIAVYVPTEDIWSEAFGSWYDLATGIEERFRANVTADILDSLLKAGYQFDLINATRIEQGAAGKYRAVILPDVESMDPETLKRLLEFQRRGGIVAVCGRMPGRAPGLQQAAERDSLVRTLVQRLFPQGSDAVFPVPSVRSLDPGNHPVATWMKAKVPPDLLSQGLAEKVGFVHRRAAGEDIYFLVNLDDSARRFHGSFRVDQGAPRILDPETGASAPVFEYRHEEGRTALSLQLAPRQAVFVVFRAGTSPRVSSHNVDRVVQVSRSRVDAEVSSNGVFFVNSGERRFRATVADLPAPLGIAGPWQLSAAGVASRNVETLQDWTVYREFAHFSGTVSYQTRFALPASWRRADQRLVLELEEVHEIAEVYLNGKPAGVAWRAPFQIDISALALADNTLEIRVTNLLFNRMLTERDLPPPYVSLSQIHPRPIPSGLVGRVTIKPVRSIQLTP